MNDFSKMLWSEIYQLLFTIKSINIEKKYLLWLKPKKMWPL